MTELKEKRKTEKLTNEEESLRNLMLEKMHDNGDFERLKNSAYARLALHPDGDKWREEIIQRTREAIENSNGGTDSIEEITLDELSETISKHGVKGIPTSIREEILSKIKVAYSSFDQRR